MRPAMVVAMAFALGGCGYSAGPLVRRDVATVHVPVFENRTFRRELEFQLTEAVQREIRERARLRIVSAGEAQTVLSGEIVGFRERVIADDAADDLVSKRIAVYVDFDWREVRSGRLLASARRFSRPADLIVSRGETVASATVESFDDLAEAIVDRMEESW